MDKPEEQHTESVKVVIGKENYKTSIFSGHHVIVSDEPLKLGGSDLGMTPYSLLLASLGSCTAITLRMYANRKEWDLETVEVILYLETVKENGQENNTIIKELVLEGNLTEEQKERLKYISSICPVQKLLSQNLQIETVLK